MILTIVKEILRGKTLGRTLQNIAMSDVTLSGKVVDLGSKSDGSSYYRFVKKEEGVEIQYTDLNPESDTVMKLDLEKEFPIESNTKDVLLLNNVLEHLYDYNTCVKESFRVLKQGGTLHGVVPFLHQIHHDPDDYFRYTASSLKRILEDAGFSGVVVKPLGFGPVTAGYEQWAPLLRLKVLIVMGTVLSIGMDKLLHKVAGKSNAVKAEHFPLTYYFAGTK